jgi:hypothetical protein
MARLQPLIELEQQHDERCHEEHDAPPDEVAVVEGRLGDAREVHAVHAREELRRQEDGGDEGQDVAGLVLLRCAAGLDRLFQQQPAIIQRVEAPIVRQRPSWSSVLGPRAAGIPDRIEQGERGCFAE